MLKSVIVAIAGAALLPAQDAPRPKNTYHSTGGASGQSRLVSPEIHLDGTVTFRLRAPDAAQVRLSLAGTKPMTKDVDGVWTITVGPLAPEI